MDKLHLAQHLEVVCKMVYKRNPSISMAAATEQRQHPKIGDQETARTPEDAGVKLVGTGAMTCREMKVKVGLLENTLVRIRKFSFV